MALCKFTYLLLLGLMLLFRIDGASSDPTNPNLWLEFAHPGNPHIDMQSPDLPIVVDSMFTQTTDVRPTLVVLMFYNDMGPRTDPVSQEVVHTVDFWEDLVFGNPRIGNWPSVAQNISASSNGRYHLVPATAGDLDGDPNGVVGWVMADSHEGCCRDSNNDPVSLVTPWCETNGHTWLPGSTAYYDCYIEEKRGAAISAADTYFDFAGYDSDGNGLITTDELLVITVFADNATTDPSCDMHDSTLNHPLLTPPGCELRAGGNTRVTVPDQIPVDQNTPTPVAVYQYVAGVGEIADVGVVTHEISHSTFGLSDLYHMVQGGACQVSLVNVTDGYLCDGVWYPPPPDDYSLMDNYRTHQILHMDPWAKLHLGFTKPIVVTHDGTYQLFDAETERSLTEQVSEPEALIIYDPLRSNPYNEYFLLENRNFTDLTIEPGLAVWLIDEEINNPRYAVRLIRKDHWGSVPDGYTWDGSETDYYDLTASSTPRNTDWNQLSGQTRVPSHIEIYDISPAADSMTFSVRMTPIFVNNSYYGAERGTESQPFNTIQEAVDAIPVTPRTLSLSSGSYPFPITIDTPLTLMNGGNENVSIGQ